MSTLHYLKKFESLSLGDNVKAGIIEEMICFDKGLSALDRRPAEVYTIAIEKAVNKHPPILKPEQRGWIKGRNDCWKSDEEAVTWDAILEIFRNNVEKVITLITKTIPQIK